MSISYEARKGIMREEKGFKEGGESNRISVIGKWKGTCGRQGDRREKQRRNKQNSVCMKMYSETCCFVC